jgi:hypothetical protein
MTRTPLLARLFRLLAPGGARKIAAPLPRARHRSARRVLLGFAAALLGLNVGMVLVMDVLWPEVRDPEYGRRLKHLKARSAEHPDRPLVVVIGSSRSSMGVRPDEWERTRPNAAGRPDPLLFNMSLVGSGPLMELFCLRRLYADGVTPDAVVLEYWPAFLREDGSYWEIDRIDHHRCYLSDRPFIREFSKDADGFEREMVRCRLNPFTENRHHLLGQVFPSWLPWHHRLDATWAGLDKWGWLPGVDEPNPPEPWMRQQRLEHCEKIYRQQFTGYSIDPVADRGLRESVALARANGARVAFAYLPEASEFRTWVPPAVEEQCRRHLAGLCRELDVPLIDGRLWLADGYLVDGFHLSRVGAAAFTRRFGLAVAATFPDLERRQ